MSEHGLPPIPLGAALPDGRTVDDLRAGALPEPLPSDLLRVSGVAAWILRPADLDRLAVLTEEPRAVPVTEHHRTAPWRPAADGPGSPASDPLDPYRTPDGQVGPDTHVTLSYRELRALIALHLGDCAHTMPRHQPWVYAAQRARAMSDGEMPLRIREVLE